VSAAKVSRDGTVIVVGHQPTLGQLATLLLAGVEADWTIKKGAIWDFPAGLGTTSRKLCYA
jgi:phosphohistidine phosphatase SixA